MSNPPQNNLNTNNAPQALEWIHLELIPLPDQAPTFENCIVWWNPDRGEIVGEKAAMINALIEKQLAIGAITNMMGSIELTNPLKKPTELASVLGQFFWVIPVPVANPYEAIASDELTKDSINRNSRNASLH